MIRVLILLLIASTSAAAQNWPCGWSLSGDTLRFNDCAGKTVQINKSGLFPTKTDTKDSLDIIRTAIASLTTIVNGKQASGNYLTGAILADSANALRITVNGKQPAGSYLGANDITGKANLSGASFTGAFGYGAGAGGTITQATSKATAVTLNKLSGQITMNAAALAAGAEVAFTLTNSFIAATDVIIVNVQSVGTAGAYLVSVGAVAAGSCSITVSNASAGSLSQAVVLNFAIIKSSNN